MTEDYFDQVPRKVHVWWARLLSLVGCVFSGGVLVSLLSPFVNDSSKHPSLIAISIWGALFLGCCWVLVKSFFSIPRRPSILARRIAVAVMFVVSLGMLVLKLISPALK